MQTCQFENCRFPQKYSIYCGKHKKFQTRDYYLAENKKMCSRFYKSYCMEPVDSPEFVQCLNCRNETLIKQRKRKLDTFFDNLFMEGESESKCHVCRKIFENFKVKNDKFSTRCKPCNIKDTLKNRAKRLKKKLKIN